MLGVRSYESKSSDTSFEPAADQDSVGAAERASETRHDFATLWAESYGRLRSYVRIFVPDLNDAEDVLQETAMAIARDFHKYDPARPFLEWAVGVARNRVMQHFRKAGQRRRFIFSDATVALIEEGFFRVEHNYDQYHDSLEFCLGRLPSRSRKMIELRYLSGLAVPQVAESIGLTVQSVYTRLSQIRTALRECIQRRMNQEGAPL